MDWRKTIAQLHESIASAEDKPEVSYLEDWYKTPAMLRWERQFKTRIDVGLMTFPIVCARYPRLCTKVEVARCFYHRYGQIDARLVAGWKVICMLTRANPKVASILRYMQDKKKAMEDAGKRQVPCILTMKDVLIIIQALSLVPEDLEIE